MSSNEAPLNSDVKDEVVRAPENEVPLTSVAAKIAEAPADLEEGSTQELSWTKEEEARVLRKVDLAIIPWLTFFYILSQIDRGNLANASIMNLETPEWTMAYQLGLTGNQFNTAVSVFFIGYVLAELPSNLLLTKIKPSVQLARIGILWGICSTLMGAAFNFGSLAACRAFLGTFEGGLSPGIIFYLGFWYKKHERASRWAFIFVGAGVAGAFSGIIAYAIAEGMNGVGGLGAWRWLFILEGIPTIIAGFASYWVIPDYPTSCRFLKDRERDIQIARLPPNAPTQATLHFDKKELIDAFKNVQVWMFMFTCLALVTSVYSWQYFIPKIIAAMGFKSYTAQLLNVGPQLCAGVFNLCTNIVSDKIKERGFLIVAAMIPALIGWSLLATIQQKVSPTTNYGIIYLTSTTFAGVPLLYTYATQNIKGTTKAASVSALVIGFGGIGGAIGGQLYQPGDAPLYKNGHTSNAALVAFVALGTLAIKAMNKWAPHTAIQVDDVSE